jgi:hypothetical protein
MQTHHVSFFCDPSAVAISFCSRAPSFALRFSFFLARAYLSSFELSFLSLSESKGPMEDAAKKKSPEKKQRMYTAPRASEPLRTRAQLRSMLRDRPFTFLAVSALFNRLREKSKTF